MRVLLWLADLGGDMRYAMRALHRNPGFAATALLTLALGIGANTAVFSVVNTVLLKPLPYPDPDRIVLLMTTWRGRGSVAAVSAPKFTEWLRNTDAFQDAAAYRLGGVVNLTDRDQPEQLAAGRVSAAFFHLFGAPVARGRTFTAEEDRPNGAHVVVVSDGRDDRGTSPVVIINQAMARQFWPDESPLNHQILIGQGAGSDFEETTPRQIVGVVGDIRHVGLQWDPRPTAYVPMTQMADNHTAAAFGITRLMEGLLFGVTRHDRVVLITMPLLLSVVALAAVWLPARRAALVDPTLALRHD